MGLSVAFSCFRELQIDQLIKFESAEKIVSVANTMRNEHASVTATADRQNYSAAVLQALIISTHATNARRVNSL
jgi:hypothetical protein